MDDLELKEFQKRIKELRLQERLSQEKMALDLGIDKAGLSKLER